MPEHDADNRTEAEQEFTIEDAKSVLPDDVDEEIAREIVPWVNEEQEQIERMQELEERIGELERVQEQNEEMREILLAVANTVPEDSELYSRIMEVV